MQPLPEGLSCAEFSFSATQNRHGKRRARKTSTGRSTPAAERVRPSSGAFLRDNDIAPDLILCSTACRARETLALVLPFLRGEATIQLEDRLYLASAAKLFVRLKQLDGAWQRVMVIAHNPGLQDLALMLSAEDENDNRQAIEDKLPTGALVQIDCPVAQWSSLTQHGGQLARLVTPRSLAAVP